MPGLLRRKRKVAAVNRNPGYLKLELAIRGLRLDESARRRTDVFRAPWVRDYVTRHVELLLPEDLWVSVPLEEAFTERSPFLLVAEGGRFFLAREGEKVEVRPLPQPAFYEKTTRRGTPMWRVATVYGGFVAVNPAAACGFSLRGVPCKFCEIGTKGLPDSAFALRVEEVVEVVREAFAEGAAEFVYFNTGYFDTDDGGIEFLEPYIRAVKRHFDTFVAVQVHPPRQNHWIDRTYAIGVDALSYNVEIHDPEILSRYCQGRVKYIGRDRYYEALEYAARIFPSGTVWSDLIVGLEPPESTMRGIDALTSIGVLPVLSLFRPLDETQLRDHPLPRVEDVAPVYAHLFHAVRRARINMGWVRDLSFGVTPLEARFFAGDEARMAVAVQQFYRTKLGTVAARNLSRLRRRLRVRRVSDSFDSSRL
ncbi:MAG: hypothetical protein KatS3mg076_1784 [Candidatus Binatia bacterium]|nr:MAG: hypothetical protein KatS3mg076_1784 [Candidatus Binatia bacterium]